jgi:hypothetical protein
MGSAQGTDRFAQDEINRFLEWQRLRQMRRIGQQPPPRGFSQSPIFRAFPFLHFSR